MIMQTQSDLWHGTTILTVRKGGTVAIGGDGQVSIGQTIVKANARKVRRIGKDLHRIGPFRLLRNGRGTTRTQVDHLVDERLRRKEVALLPGEDRRLLDAERLRQLLRRARQLLAERLDLVGRHEKALP